MCGNDWAMKRSVQKSTNLSDYHLAKFTIFALTFFLLNRQIVNLADFENRHEPLVKPELAMFYSRCWHVVIFSPPNPLFW